MTNNRPSGLPDDAVWILEDDEDGDDTETTTAVEPAFSGEANIAVAKFCEICAYIRDSRLFKNFCIFVLDASAFALSNPA